MLNNFISDLVLNTTNVDTPTGISKTNQLPNDHCFMTKIENLQGKVCLPPIEVGRKIIFHHRNLATIEDKNKIGLFSKAT